MSIGHAKNTVFSCFYLETASQSKCQCFVVLLQIILCQTQCMLSHKYTLSQDNLQCQCFQFNNLQQTQFLSRSAVAYPKHKITNISLLPTNIQQALTSGNIKRSLKREAKPTRCNPEAHSSQIFANILHSKQSSFLKQTQLKQANNSKHINFLSHPNMPVIQRSQIRDFQLAYKNLGNPHDDYLINTKNIVNQSMMQTPKIHFDFSRKQIQPHHKITQKPSYVHPLQSTLFIPSMNKSSSATQFRLDQTRLVKKQFQPNDNQSISQEISRHQYKEQKSSPLTKGKQAYNQQAPAAKNKRQRKLSKVFYSCDLSSEMPKKKSCQDVTKVSLIKHKVSAQGKTKHEKKNKGRLLLRRMSQVQEIKSLIDEEDIQSDQESVVLGRLEQYNKTEFYLNGIPHLDKQSYDNQSISSTVMTIPHTPTNQKTLLYQSIF